ncbi:MAG TPA: AMP-dependent synthetase/ligase [Deltaproteobacteria bacterium]|jgi:long-chain acyl-CoA synthetase|nr:AMP-dependent synthetase/ligase [Deltaproteobacteria bacterium]HOI08086.1 AMP-dependent synthetase/ligase [Deltaproteobacteria bacterium]
MELAENGKVTGMDAFYTYPSNLVDLFESSVGKWADKRLFGTKNQESGQYEWITYGAVAERVNNLRAALAGLGLARGEKAGVIVSNCTEWFVCEGATHGLGGVFVPMYEKELVKTWKYIIADAAVKYLFVRDKAIYEKVMGFKDSIPTLKDIFVIFGEGENSMTGLEKIGAANPVESYKPRWSETASIIYTSGTTGDPKGVLLSHGALTCSAKAGVEAFYLNENMHVVSILPWAHVFGQSADLHCYIHCGGGIAFAESVEMLMKNFQEVKPTGLSAVPRVFNKIYDVIMQGVAADPVKKQFFDAACAEAVKNRGLSEKTKEFKDFDALVFSKIREIFGGELKLVVTGSAIMKPEIALFFRDIGMPTFDCYGMTETAPTFTLNSPRDGNKYGTVGKAVPGMHLVIDKSRVGEDSPDGEIIAYGAHVMQGYHNKPEATAEVMTEDTWNGFRGVRTGDRGWIDEDGFLHITGRFKDEYKLSNGKYVHPEAIELEIKLLRFVANTILYGDGKEYNVALVVPDFQALKLDPKTAQWCQGTPEEAVKNPELTDYLSKAITDHLKKSFGGYEIPQKYLFIHEDFTLENGMLTQTMKLIRRNVMKKYGEMLQALYQ